MKAGNLKGALLEYIVRQLLKSCGFTNVKADNLFSFESRGLFFVNGRGAAHDADIIMNPPIQMPFAYPTQVLFECKAYGLDTGLSMVRNALGLRNDLNEFEIVTRDSLLKRQNNRRASYAIDTRTRYLYQVGVASVNEFTKDAFEFAANNKVPLLSLSWFLEPRTIYNINQINQELIAIYPEALIKKLYKFLKDRDGDMHSSKYNEVFDYLSSENVFGDIITYANTVIRSSYVGLLETGDMIFLFSRGREEKNVLNNPNEISFSNLKAEIYWDDDLPNIWRLIVYKSGNLDRQTEFVFYMPKRIFDHWKEFNLDKTTALDIKQEFFSRIFVFNQRNNREVPFSIININREWLDRVRQDQRDLE